MLPAPAGARVEDCRAARLAEGKPMNKKATDDCDLDAVQAEVNASKDYFLEALGEYNGYDGEQIVEKFLAPFQDRSPATRGIEQEAEQSIRRFNAVCASLTSRVSLALLRMQSTVLGIQLYVIRSGIDKIGGPIGTAPGSSPMDILAAEVQKLGEAGKAVQASGEWATKAACQVGTNIVKLQTMAGDLIRLRTMTLRVFKEENLGTSFTELMEQLQHRQYAKTGMVLLDGAAERIWELAKELAAFLAEKNPSVELFHLLSKLGKAIRGKTPDTTAGGTELMNELVSQLRHESDLLGDVDKAYEDAMQDFDKIDAVIR